MTSPILAPAAVLVMWSLLMLFWMAATRVVAMGKSGVQLGSAVGGRGQDLEGVLPDRINWKSHNYTHLMEQPTIFYPTVILLALVGADSGINLQFTWAYVIIRILHSLVQALWNRVAVRFALFLASTLALFVLAINALRATL
jgi:hypothetical protein